MEDLDWKKLYFEALFALMAMESRAENAENELEANRDYIYAMMTKILKRRIT